MMMSKTILKILVLFLLITTIYSCKDNDNPIQEQLSIFMTAKVDGVDFISDFPILLIQPSDDTTSFSIGGINDNNVTIQVIILDYNGPSTYAVGENEGNGFIIGGGDIPTHIADNQGGGSGTVTISENSNLITGPFSFIAINSIENSSINVTEGSFRVLKLLL